MKKGVETPKEALETRRGVPKKTWKKGKADPKKAFKKGQETLKKHETNTEGNTEKDD